MDFDFDTVRFAWGSIAGFSFFGEFLVFLGFGFSGAYFNGVL